MPSYTTFSLEVEEMLTRRYDEDSTVLHLITRFQRGGAEKTTVNTIHALRDAPEAYDLHLGFGASYDQEHVAEIESIGVKTHRFRLLRHWNPVPQIGAVGTIAYALRRHDVDIIHTHSTEAGIVGRIAATIASTPVVVHEIHGDPVSADRNDLFNRVLIGLERITTALTTVQIVKSERIKRDYLNRGVGLPEQYETIYHGVDLKAYRSTTTDTAPPKNGPRLLYVGRLAKGKGLSDLLSAVETIDSDREFDVLIAGDGPLSEDLEREIRARRLDGTVSRLGYRDDVPALLTSADAFVLPSYREGTPRVITESLAAGVPVVSTNIAGIPEQVRDGVNGHLFEPGDVESLSALLERLITDPDHLESLASKTELGLSKFDMNTVQEQYREFYRDLVNEWL